MLITLGTFVLERTIRLHNCGANQVVTLKLNGSTYGTVTADKNGDAIAKVYDDGTYTITTPYQSQSRTLVVDSDHETYDLYFNKYIFIAGQGFLMGGSVSAGDLSANNWHIGGASAYGQDITGVYSIPIDVTPYKHAYIDGENGTWFGGNSYCNLSIGGVGASWWGGNSGTPSSERGYKTIDISGLTGNKNLVMHHWLASTGGGWGTSGESYMHNCYLTQE